MSRDVVSKLDENVLAMYTSPFGNRDKRKQTHIFPAQLKDANLFLGNIYAQNHTLSD